MYNYRQKRLSNRLVVDMIKQTQPELYVVKNPLKASIPFGDVDALTSEAERASAATTSAEENPSLADVLWMDRVPSSR